MDKELERLFEIFGWEVKEGADKLKGSAADIYAENKEANMYMRIDDGMVNNYGEITHIYSNDSGGKIFEGSFSNGNEFKYLMKLIGVKAIRLPLSNSNMIKNLSIILDSLTEEELKEHKEKYFPESTIPKGWVSIEDHLPQWLAKDVIKGYTNYKVKDEISEFVTGVTDPNIFKYYAMECGITHWFNP